MILLFYAYTPYQKKQGEGPAMTSRQTGRRISSIASEQRRRTAGRGGTRQSPQRKDAPLSPGERRHLIQLVACGGIFVFLVVAKLLAPARMERVNAVLSGALRKNVDVQAVFSAVGKAFSGDAANALEEVYQTVFHPEETEKSLEVSAALPPIKGNAMDTLRKYRSIPEKTSEKQEASTHEETATEEKKTVSDLAYILYSDQNLPENVSMEQAVLGFDYCAPVSGTLTSGFGYRDHPVEGEERFHYGVDLAANTGTEVDCFADGSVTAVGESSSYGKYCIVAHRDGYSTLYAHCSRITVSSGTAVTEGQKIAEVGETGMATGPHLHFELHQDNMYLNPIYYVSGT